MNEHKKNAFKSYLVLFVLASIAVLLWETPVVYPVKLFVVFLHEMSHGFAAQLTGGIINKIEIGYKVGGVCYTEGGSTFAVASAGYMGSIFWGGLILIIANRSKFIRIGTLMVGFLLVSITILYIRSGFGFMFGLGFGILFTLLSVLAPDYVNRVVLKFLGIVSCLYVFVDIGSDLFSSSIKQSDAQILANHTGIPAIVWAVIWMLVSLVILWYAVDWSVPDPELEQVNKHDNKLE